MMRMSTNQKIVAAVVAAAGAYLIYSYAKGRMPMLRASTSPSLPPKGASYSSGEAQTPEQVKTLQAALNKLPSGPRVKVDGIYGAETAAAVRAFQESVGLPQTGTADQPTILAMREVLRAMGTYNTPLPNA